MKTLFLVCVLIAQTTTLSAQDNSYFVQGMLGTYPVAMMITCNDGNCDDSRYFYLSKGKDIVLQGKTKGNKYTLYTSDYGTGKEMIHERFELIRTGSNFTGTWKNDGGKPLPVKLSAIDVASITNKYEYLPSVRENKQKQPGEYLRSSLLSFVRDSATTYKGKEIIWFHEAKSGMPFFRLGNGFATDVRTLINPLLEEKHITGALNQLGCTSRWGDGSMDYTISVNYLDANLLGFRIFSSYSCGGAHPDFGGEGVLLDLNNGKSYELDEIISFDTSVTTEARGGFEAYSKYRSDYFAPRLLALQKEVNNIIRPKDTDDYCDYTDMEIWDFPSWNFTEKGIEFTPVFARVARACEEPFLIPFSVLAKYRNPEFPYIFPDK